MWHSSKKHLYSKLVLDPKPLDHKEHYKKRFNTNADWFEFYSDVKEEIPLDAPKPLGKAVEITAFIDADHAGDRLTRRSRTGFIIFIQNAPIIWYSKKQGSIEGATFGSEMIAAKTLAETNRGLRYKLRMMGVPVEDPTYTFCDNQSVLHNTTKPESTLKKKHHSIAYHRCKEAVAARTIRVAKQGTEKNLADLFTKILTVARQMFLLERFTY